MVLEAFLVHLEMTAPVLVAAAGGTFQTCYNYHGRGHILASGAHNLGIVGLCW